MILKTFKRIFGLNEVAFSTLLCNAIEHYDFIVYGILSSTISKVFFSQDEFLVSGDSYVGALLGFLVFASAFAARPFGAVLFGYWGDKRGRKVALEASTFLLVGSVLGMAMLPTPEVWGVFSVLALLLLRIMQGLAYGAEMGGVVLISESVGKEQIRVVWVARIIFMATGMICGVLVVKICGAILSHDQMNSWGWRIPFFVAFLVSLPVPKLRKLIIESAEFTEYKARGRRENIPKSLMKNILGVLLIASMSGLSAGFFYISVVYMEISNKAGFFEYEFATVLLAMTASSNLLIKDFQNRRRLFVVALLLIAVIIFPLTHYISAGHAVARIAWGIVSGLYLGWYGSFVTLLFPVGARQTCFSIGYNMGYLIGGLAPALCLWFAHTTGMDIMPQLYIAGFATFIALVFAFAVRVEDGRYKLLFCPEM
ncbi:proline/betaine transporter [Anaplasma platys]|uniref:Proline/betaine transporter n=1 Tax=Anaplasma platys TaxID=949 RepID=A0A858PYN7_9RICK|nr:MFS transporter [Anaplasma platys]QJC27680.1 proline/betaine transporter [Anaplasma platys]